VSEIKIEKGVPIPQKHDSQKRGSLTATLKAMEVGDSFLYAKSQRGALPTVARHAGIRVATRSEGADHVRVWRVE
jgi:hypothetical protein